MPLSRADRDDETKKCTRVAAAAVGYPLEVSLDAVFLPSLHGARSAISAYLHRAVYSLQITLQTNAFHGPTGQNIGAEGLLF